jgi:hypothetical protein
MEKALCPLRSACRQPGWYRAVRGGSNRILRAALAQIAAGTRLAVRTYGKLFHIHNFYWRELKGQVPAIRRVLPEEFPQNSDTRRYRPVQSTPVASSRAIWCRAAAGSKQRQKKSPRKGKDRQSTARFAALWRRGRKARKNLPSRQPHRPNR